MKSYRNLGVRDDYICPLCGEKQVSLLEIDKYGNDLLGKCTEHTYIYICELCPHISLEFWEHEDLENFNLYMNDKLIEVKEVEE